MPVILLTGMFFTQAASAQTAELRPWPSSLQTPSLQLRDLEGKTWTARQLRGKVVVLNFWATWCGPCVEEQHVLNALAKSDFGGDKPVILGINFKEPASTIQAFLVQHPIDYPVLTDKTGDAFKKWTKGVLPTTVVLDRNGRARWRIIGALDTNDKSLREAVQKLLAEGAQGRAAAAE